MEQIKIIIADDHRLVRDGIKSLLKNEKEMIFVADAENGKEAIEKIKEFEPHVILMDITMPILDGIEASKIISKEYPQVGVIILSMHEEPEYVIKSVQSGICSYLLKNAEKNELITAIRKAALGQKYFNATISELMAVGILEKRKQENEEVDLTSREKEVLHYVAQGLSTKQIAEKLFIGTRTVETHRLNLLKKFEAQNSTELIKLAVERKIITI
jgi:DNA-binding NarL/FixJ family response regulator